MTPEERAQRLVSIDPQWPSEIRVGAVRILLSHDNQLASSDIETRVREFVAREIRDAVAAETERCAALCEAQAVAFSKAGMTAAHGTVFVIMQASMTAKQLAELLRGRSGQ